MIGIYVSVYVCAVVYVEIKVNASECTSLVRKKTQVGIGPAHLFLVRRVAKAYPVEVCHSALSVQWSRIH
jgi:hypothetical protein